MTPLRYRLPIKCAGCGKKAFQYIEWNGQVFAECEISEPPCCGKWEINGLPQQSTGLHDKNADKIFDGDILRTQWQHGGVTCYDYEMVGEVKWSQEFTEFEIEKEGDGMLVVYPMHSFEREELLEDGIEIIGNIYQNPELLSPSSK